MKYILSGGFNLFIGSMVFISTIPLLMLNPIVAIFSFIISIMDISTSFNLLSTYVKYKKGLEGDFEEKLSDLLKDNRRFNIISIILIVSLCLFLIGYQNSF